MIVQCENCNTRFELDESRLGTGKRKLRCRFCQTVFYAEAPSRSPEQPVGLAEKLRESRREEADSEETLVLSIFNKPKGAEPPPPPKPVQPALASQATGSGQLRRVMVPAGRMAEFLRDVAWFEGMAWEDMKQMAPFWDMYRVAQGTTIFRPGDRHLFLGIVVQGEIQIGFDDGTGYKHRQAVLDAGGSFGELSLFDGQPRVSTAVTSKESFILILSGKRLAQLGEKHAHLWQSLVLRIVRFFCQRIRVKGGYAVDFLAH